MRIQTRGFSEKCVRNRTVIEELHWNENKDAKLSFVFDLNLNNNGSPRLLCDSKYIIRFQSVSYGCYRSHYHVILSIPVQFGQQWS